MNDSTELKKLYIDMPSWNIGVMVDDFIIAIGKKQSNSVYHVAEVSVSQKKNSRVTRYNMLVLKTDLPTAIMRDSSQSVIPIYWYPRNKK